MKPNNPPSILSLFDLENRQKQAATDSNPAIVVTAGAGSGKTRTLVGRYLRLLEAGYPTRSLVAITFTKKAAREMRTRIRQTIEEWLTYPPFAKHPYGAPPEVGGSPVGMLRERGDWEDIFAELDAARICTIHSLCTEILRAHPAEAGVDPNFGVLEEGLAAAFRAQAVDAALAWAANDPQAACLFGVFEEGELRRILTTLLNRRLDIADLPNLPAPLDRWSSAIEAWMASQLSDPAWKDSLETLTSLCSQVPDDKLELARREVLSIWDAVREAHVSQDWEAAFANLARLRKAISTGGRKGNWPPADLEAVRQAMRTLREYYEAELKPLVGGTSPARWALDVQVTEALPAMHLLVDQVLQEYQHLKDDQQALDFDDLEGKAAQLLTGHSHVRTRWQDEIHAVLVDEFQDTNDRQRQIVYALAGFEPSSPSRPPRSLRSIPAGSKTSEVSAGLFIVGDAKQSIYKFRGADVTVFRQVQADIEVAGGLPLDLDLTFRAHQPLLVVLNALLAPILGESEDPARPYEVPFAPLRAYRQSPNSDAIHAPYVEFHLGLGEEAESGRGAAAAALATRLHELHTAGEFEWGDMALLFRSSTAFGVYENALERAGIPFVTVAGRGFYDRPEIRDLLNALAAIADPSDDLALAGLLRSPAIGLSDADIYPLRFPDGDADPRPIWESLAPSGSVIRRQCLEQVVQPADHESTGSNGTVSGVVPATQNEILIRAYNIITALHTLAGRAPAAEVLKRFLDLTGYRTILGTVPEGGRMQRNVDKLLADAHRSRLVSLGDFLAYVQTLRDVGLREGEAPVEAEGAVQLMSVHKAKGLEFPLVVLADAAYEHRGGAGSVLFDDDLGLLLGVRASDGARPVTWKLAGLAEAEKDGAEDKRLLYVAATRAREKLLVSGYVKRKRDGTFSLWGWLGRLGQVIGLDEIKLMGEVDAPQVLDLNLSLDSGEVACTLHLLTPNPLTPNSLTPNSLTSNSLTSNSLTPGPPPPALPSPPVRSVTSAAQPDLVDPLPSAESENADQKSRSRESDPPQRVWRVVPRAKRPRGPAWVVGKLVHESLRHWRFPAVGGFEDFITPFALEAGLTDPAEIRATIHEVERLLRRFHADPLCATIEVAERYHEVPYALPNDRGIIDILYRSEGGWVVADFKTDELRSEAEMRAAIQRENYSGQLQRYAEAVTAQLGQRPRVLLVFLRVGGAVRVVDSEGSTLENSH
ncbi:MAG: UvrD-helicase domain-containing protein [Chloroflexota bacterium]